MESEFDNMNDVVPPAISTVDSVYMWVSQMFGSSSAPSPEQEAQDVVTEDPEDRTREDLIVLCAIFGSITILCLLQKLVFMCITRCVRRLQGRPDVVKVIKPKRSRSKIDRDNDPNTEKPQTVERVQSVPITSEQNDSIRKTVRPKEDDDPDEHGGSAERNDDEEGESDGYSVEDIEDYEEDEEYNDYNTEQTEYSDLIQKSAFAVADLIKSIGEEAKEDDDNPEEGISNDVAAPQSVAGASAREIQNNDINENVLKNSALDAKNIPEEFNPDNVHDIKSDTETGGNSDPVGRGSKLPDIRTKVSDKPRYNASGIMHETPDPRQPRSRIHNGAEIGSENGTSVNTGIPRLSTTPEVLKPLGVGETRTASFIPKPKQHKKS